MFLLKLTQYSPTWRKHFQAVQDLVHVSDICKDAPVSQELPAHAGPLGALAAEYHNHPAVGRLVRALHRGRGLEDCRRSAALLHDGEGLVRQALAPECPGVGDICQLLRVPQDIVLVPLDLPVERSLGVGGKDEELGLRCLLWRGRVMLRREGI